VPPHHVPAILPCAPRPIPGELRTAWLHRVAAANAITFPELLDAFATRLPADIPEQIWFDDTLPSPVCARLAAWCRLAPPAVAMLDVSRAYPWAGDDVWTIELDARWHAGVLTLDPVLRLAFCCLCLREQRHRGEPLHIRAEWALAWLTHCPRHRTWLLNDCGRCIRSDVLDFPAARRARLVCRFCSASVDVPVTARPSPALDEVFRFQRTLLACASGLPVEPEWVGPCAPGVFLGLSRDLLSLLASLDADGATVLAEYLPDRGWEFPRLRRCRCRPWVLLSIGERLSLVSAVVALLRGRGRRLRPGHRAEDPFQQLWPAMTTAQRDTVRRQARRWPPPIRRRVVTASALSP
jgi:TniQ protein